MNDCILLGLDLGVHIGIACLRKKELITFETTHFIDVFKTPYQYLGVEDYIPYRSKGFRISGDGILTVKQLGIIEFDFKNVITMSRSKICAMITGMSNAKKSQVRQRLSQVLEGLVTLKGRTDHEIDAIATVLTLGIILGQKGLIIKGMSHWTPVFQTILEKKGL